MNTNLQENTEVTETTRNQRRHLDFYETPPWQTQSLLRRVQISGAVFECCVGDGCLAKELRGCEVVTNDIDPSRAADFHLDASDPESWSVFPSVDWVVTNPPFNCALPILKAAYGHARFGVVMLLRLSFLEPTKERSAFLCDAPPQRQIILPRWSYKGNGSTDSVTTAWMVWQKAQRPIEVVNPNEKQFRTGLEPARRESRPTSAPTGDAPPPDEDPPF